VNKTIRLGTVAVGRRAASVFCRIKIEDGKLSISGVEGPLPSGNALGSCGQIDMHLKASSFKTFAPGWNFWKVKKFLDIWARWHLNDMQAGCEHQRAAKWEDRRIDANELPANHMANRDERGVLAIWVRPDEHKEGLLCAPCEVCGYKYGSMWRKEELPADVVGFLQHIPDTDKTPAWV